MKQIILKMSFLFVTMSVLTSSKEDTSKNKPSNSITNGHTCLQTGNDYAINLSCQSTAVAEEKKAAADVAPVDDNELSLSPISRFILLQ